MKQAIIILFLIGMVSVCHSGQYSSKLLQHKEVKISDDFIGRGGLIIPYQDGVLGLEGANSMRPIYYINSDGKLFRFGNRGQGPKDITYPFSLQNLNEKAFGVHDALSSKFMEGQYRVGEAEPFSILKSTTFEKRYLRIIKTAFGQFVGLSLDDGLLALMDPEGKEIATFFEYPYKDNRERSINNKFRAMAYQGWLTANPQGSKCVFAPIHGNILHFYDIKKDVITLVKKIEKKYIKYETQENSDSYSSAFIPDNVVGYVSITASNKYVYALYDGKTIGEHSKSKTPDSGKELTVYDWQGNIAKQYELDIICSHLAVSLDDKKLYAIAMEEEPMLVVFDLE